MFRFTILSAWSHEHPLAGHHAAGRDRAPVAARSCCGSHSGGFVEASRLKQNIQQSQPAPFHSEACCAAHAAASSAKVVAVCNASSWSNPHGCKDTRLDPARAALIGNAQPKRCAARAAGNDARGGQSWFARNHCPVFGAGLLVLRWWCLASCAPISCTTHTDAKLLHISIGRRAREVQVCPPSLGFCARSSQRKWRREAET